MSSNLEKYLNQLSQSINNSWETEKMFLQLMPLAMAVMNGRTPFYVMSKDNWIAMGKPPATYLPETDTTYEGYKIDLSDPTLVRKLWAWTLMNCIEFGCRAATDPTDVILAINSDNLEHRISDRDAMIAISQIAGQSLNAYQKMQQNIANAKCGR